MIQRRAFHSISLSLAQSLNINVEVEMGEEIEAHSIDLTNTYTGCIYLWSIERMFQSMGSDTV